MAPRPTPNPAPATRPVAPTPVYQAVPAPVFPRPSAAETAPAPAVAPVPVLGVAAPVTTDRSRVCPRCRGTVDDQAQFCRFCGASLGSAPATAKPAAAADASAGAPVQVPPASTDPHVAAFWRPPVPVGFPSPTHASPVAVAPAVDHGPEVATHAHDTVVHPEAPQPTAGAPAAPVVSPPTNVVETRTATNAPTPPPAYGRLVLITKEGGEGASHPLREQLDIGRTEGDVVVADDRYLSPRHARIVRQANPASHGRSHEFVLVDLASTNGVYLRLGRDDGHETTLTDQDLFLVGQQVLKFEVVRDAEEGLGPATQHGTLIFGSPTVPRYARICQRTVEGVTRDVFHVQKAETVLGRESGDIVFPDDPFLSRRHAAIKADQAGRRFVLADLGSSNGTFIQIRGQVTIKNGDQFRIGQQLFRVDLSAAHAPWNHARDAARDRGPCRGQRSEDRRRGSHGSRRGCRHGHCRGSCRDPRAGVCPGPCRGPRGVPGPGPSETPAEAPAQTPAEVPAATPGEVSPATREAAAGGSPVPSPSNPCPAPSQGEKPQGEVRVKLFARTDVGQIREHNEDNFLVADLSRRSRGLLDANRNGIVGPFGHLFAVCDGMGGAAAGEVASQLAVDIIYERMVEGLDQKPCMTRDEIARRLVLAVEAAGLRIFQEAKADRSRRGMGTTVTAAALVDNHVFFAQVGDSRGYILRNGVLTQVTRDQSLVNQLIEAGQLTAEEAETFEHNNIILQALGTADTVQVDLTYVEIHRGDTMLLCSDGLSGMVRFEEIREILRTAGEPVDICKTLTDRANQAGGHDNITVIIVTFDGEGLGTSDPTAGPVSDPVKYRKYSLPEEPSDGSTPPDPSSLDTAPPPERERRQGPGQRLAGARR